MTTKVFDTDGVCCKSIEMVTTDNTIISVKVNGGCPGQGKLISKICAGKKLGEVYYLMKGITCSTKGTSCADQIAKIIDENYLAKK